MLDKSDEKERINKGLARAYCLLFSLSLTTIITSIISSESRPHFEMRLRQQDSLVVCTNNMPSAGLECQIESTESGVMSIEDAKIIKEYTLNVPRKTSVEGLEFVTYEDKNYLMMSTGNFGGSINVLELSETEDEWSLKSQVMVDSQYFGMGLTTVDMSTYLLTWKA